MKGQAFSINVPGRNGYTIYAYTPNGGENENSVLNILQESNAFDDPQEYDFAIVEELTENEISVFNCPMLNLETKKYTPYFQVLKDLRMA